MAIIDRTDQGDFSPTHMIRPKDIDYIFLGMVSMHNFPCPVFPQVHAMHNGNTGTYGPSDEARAAGWRLVQIRPTRRWLYNLIGKHLFKHWSVFSPTHVPFISDDEAFRQADSRSRTGLATKR
jgi:hypothetical protein